MNSAKWPQLSYENGKETYQTIHLWSQIIGKIKLAKMPWINHSWHVTLFVTPFGLTTGDMPANGQHFQLNLNFLKHELEIITSFNEYRVFNLLSLSVRDCYLKVLASLHELGIEVKLNPTPSEMVDPLPFTEDHRKTYEPAIAESLHKALLAANEVFTQFRAGFTGKSSAVHFFWGSFDLAVSRFSGEEAPDHPGGIPNLPDWVAREAYSQEVCSCGFWPGSENLPEAAFYSYIYPEPEAYKTYAVKPASAYYHKDLKEFILPYKNVCEAEFPSKVLMDFLTTTYLAAAETAGWEMKAFENKFADKYL